MGNRKIGMWLYKNSGGDKIAKKIIKKLRERDIETLDDIDSIESFEDFTEESDEVSIQEPEVKSEESIEDFNLDFYRFTLIQEALKKFYEDDVYEQAFIEAVFIADAVGVGSDLKNYLEEELFVTPIVRKIDLVESLLDLTKDEVAHAS